MKKFSWMYGTCLLGDLFVTLVLVSRADPPPHTMRVVSLLPVTSTSPLAPIAIHVTTSLCCLRVCTGAPSSTEVHLRLQSQWPQERSSRAPGSTAKHLALDSSASEPCNSSNAHNKVGVKHTHCITRRGVRGHVSRDLGWDGQPNKPLHIQRKRTLGRLRHGTFGC